LNAAPRLRSSKFTRSRRHLPLHLLFPLGEENFLRAQLLLFSSPAGERLNFPCRARLRVPPQSGRSPAYQWRSQSPPLSSERLSVAGQPASTCPGRPRAPSPTSAPAPVLCRPRPASACSAPAARDQWAARPAARPPPFARPSRTRRGGTVCCSACPDAWSWGRPGPTRGFGRAHRDRKAVRHERRRLMSAHALARTPALAAGDPRGVPSRLSRVGLASELSFCGNFQIPSQIPNLSILSCR
jgi:hypothetical protein